MEAGASSMEGDKDQKKDKHVRLERSSTVAAAWRVLGQHDGDGPMGRRKVDTLKLERI